jgi:hypothetical protein
MLVKPSCKRMLSSELLYLKAPVPIVRKLPGKDTDVSLLEEPTQQQKKI